MCFPGFAFRENVKCLVSLGIKCVRENAWLVSPSISMLALIFFIMSVLLFLTPSFPIIFWFSSKKVVSRVMNGSIFASLWYLTCEVTPWFFWGIALYGISLFAFGLTYVHYWCNTNDTEPSLTNLLLNRKAWLEEFKEEKDE